MQGTEKARGLLQGGAWVALWILLSVVSALARPLLPIDETRYASVAWDMWTRSDWLVPHLNGIPYSHKPPLLFWTALIGWRAFGVSEWWLRALGPIFALAALFLTVGLTRRLAPDRPDASRRAGWILLGTALWSIFGTTLLFDTLLSLCALIALTGVVIASEGRAARGWALAGVALGLGTLAKGPVILLHVVPAALLAPYWAAGGIRPARWYGGLAAAVVAGAAIGLAWALPAASAGGETYAERILWVQTTGRMTESFAHARPIWWYLPMLPVLVLPWSLVPRVWSVLVGSATTASEERRGGGASARGDLAVRFALCVILPALLSFSLVSGKQIHYLVPELPVFALLLAVCSEGSSSTSQWRLRDHLPLALLLAIAGLAIVVWPYVGRMGIPGVEDLPSSALDVRIWAAVFPIGGTLLVLFGSRRIGSLPASTTAVSLLFVGTLLSVMPALRVSYDVAPMARRIAAWQREGRPVAMAGAYNGQYNFAGRLLEPIDKIRGRDIRSWSEAHPGGVLMDLYRSWPRPGIPEPIVAEPYRGRVIAAFDASTVVASSFWGVAPDGQAGSRTQEPL